MRLLYHVLKTDSLPTSHLCNQPACWAIAAAAAMLHPSLLVQMPLHMLNESARHSNGTATTQQSDGFSRVSNTAAVETNAQGAPMSHTGDCSEAAGLPAQPPLQHTPNVSPVCAVGSHHGLTSLQPVPTPARSADDYVPPSCQRPSSCAGSTSP